MCETKSEVFFKFNLYSQFYASEVSKKFHLINHILLSTFAIIFIIKHIQYFTKACVISQIMHFSIFYSLFKFLFQSFEKFHNFFLFSHNLITFSLHREFSDFSSDPIKLSQRTEHHYDFLLPTKLLSTYNFFLCISSASQQAWKIFPSTIFQWEFFQFSCCERKWEKFVREFVAQTTTMHVMWVNEWCFFCLYRVYCEKFARNKKRQKEL